MKFWILRWNTPNKMVGIFTDESLSQCSNVDEKYLLDELFYLRELYKIDSYEIGFIKDHDELNKMRKERNLEVKPTFDIWIDNWMKEHNLK